MQYFVGVEWKGVSFNLEFRNCFAEEVTLNLEDEGCSGDRGEEGTLERSVSPNSLLGDCLEVRWGWSVGCMVGHAGRRIWAGNLGRNLCPGGHDVPI